MSADIVRDIHLRQKDRTLAFMGVDLKRLDSRVISAAEASASAHDFVKIYEPDYRIFAFGEGANLVSLCMLASAAGFTVHAFSPDEDALSFLDHTSIEGTRIHRKTNFAAMPVDDYTAVVTLFHEHEWERDILHAALNSPADYIGALGSRATHQARLDALGEAPTPTRALDFIRGPVGLDIGAQNPNEIAVSIVAEIIEHRRRKTS